MKNLVTAFQVLIQPRCINYRLFEEFILLGSSIDKQGFAYRQNQSKSSTSTWCHLFNILCEVNWDWFLNTKHKSQGMESTKFHLKKKDISSIMHHFIGLSNLYRLIQSDLLSSYWDHVSTLWYVTSLFLLVLVLLIY